MLPPCLFNLYMEGLVTQLTKMGFCYRLSGKGMNNLGHAKDLCLISPTSRVCDCYYPP